MKKCDLKSEIKEYIVELLSEEEDDKEPTKAELEKEKVKGAPLKFKVSNSEFEDFKDKLKTLVTKVKDMEKGEARDKKMAALKQFIKKPELVKAFKERDVKIDTGGLIGEDKRLTPEQEKIVYQIKAGYGIYGGKYKKATSEKEKEEIINKALENMSLEH